MTLRTLAVLALLAAPALADDKAPADRPDGPPVVTAKAWCVADGVTGKVLAGSNAGDSRPIASTTKIMTCWLVLQLVTDDPKGLDRMVTVSERAAGTPGSSAKLIAGDRLPVKELLYGLMLPSGNDAAAALAETFGPQFPAVNGAADADPVVRFVAEMNRRAAALGLKDTHYADPAGLNKDSRSSPRDLAALTARALADERFRGVVTTRKHAGKLTASDGTPRENVWVNTNRLLDIDGYDGVKTGTTTPAGNCLVASARREGRHLIVVVLGASSTDGRYADARNLFRWAVRVPTAK